MPDAVTPPTADRPVLVIPHFTRSILVRSLVTWAFVRVAASAVMRHVEAAAGLPPGNPLRLNPVAALLVIGIVGVVGWVSARRRNEDLFLLCLGYDRARLVGLLVLPVLLLEIAIAIAMRA